MQSFTVIPPDDIISFLQTNNISSSSDIQQNYLIAWNSLRSNTYQSVPSSIADWIIALNLATSNIRLPPMTFLDILAMSDVDLQILTNQLTLPNLDKERLIRILRYSNALLDDMSMLENLPDDVLFEILVNLDCKSIVLMCRLSNKLDNFCQRNLDNLLRQNLSRITGLNTYDYTRQQLINLCQSSSYIKNISAGYHYSLILTNTGQIYAFGRNEYGQLGLGDNIAKNAPTLIPTLNQIVQIAAGGDHSLVLSNTGQIYAFGYNGDGQLGLGNNYHKNIPTLIPNLNNMLQISAGLHHSLVLSNTGQIYAFGGNRYGQLGLGNNYHKNTPTLIPNLNNMIQIAAGGDHSLVLSNTGQIYAFGANNYGQLGLGDNDNRDNPTEVMSIY